MSINLDFTIESEMLTKGLRPFKEVPRDSRFLVESKGAMGRHGALAANETMVPLDTSVITDEFPYPQIFAFSKFTIVCGATKIYEIVDGVLTLKITVESPCGGFWGAVDFYDYIYISNGEIVVVRDALTGEYTESTTLPVACAMCNYNGQVLVSPSNSASHYTAGTQWTLAAPVTPVASSYTWSIVYKDDLYITAGGILYKWDKISDWVEVVPKTLTGAGDCVYNAELVEHIGRLYLYTTDPGFRMHLASWAPGESVWTIHFEYYPSGGSPHPSTGACSLVSYNGYIYFGNQTGRGYLYRWEVGDTYLQHIGTTPYPGLMTNQPILPFIENGEVRVIMGYYSSVFSWTGNIPTNINDTSTLTLLDAGFTSLILHTSRYTQTARKGENLYSFLYESVGHYSYLYKWTGFAWVDADECIWWDTAPLENYVYTLHLVRRYGQLFIFDSSIENLTEILPDIAELAGGVYGEITNLLSYDNSLFILTSLGRMYKYTATSACVY